MAIKRRAPNSSRMQGDLHAVEDCQRAVHVDLAAVERFLFRLNRELGLQRGSAFIRLVSDGEMARLNHAFRQRRKTTDVLSFPSETRSRPATLRRRAKAVRGSFLGDIAISPTVARRNAETYGRTVSEEILILILHGVLHLLGYDHETDRGEMERVEATLRRRLGLS